VVIAIVGSIAGLYFGLRIQQQKADATAKEINLVMTMASQQALLQAEIIGLQIMPQGYRMLRLETRAQKARWVEIKKIDVFKPVKIDKDINIKLVIDDKVVAATTSRQLKPQIIFYTEGNMTAFDMFISRQQQYPIYSIKGNADGTIKLTKINKPQ